MRVLECSSGCEQVLSLNNRWRVLGSGLIITPIQAPIKPMAKLVNLNWNMKTLTTALVTNPPKP